MATFEFRSGAWRAKIVRRRLGIDESATFPTKSQAQAWATKREAEILAGARGMPTKHTLADAIDRFIRDVAPKRNGYRWEKIRLEKFKEAAPKLVCRPLGTITSDDLAKWRDRRLGEVSPSSVAREMNLWGALFSVAAGEWKWIQNSPIKGVKRPLEPSPRRRGISASEIDAISAKLNNDAGGQVKAAFLLSLETGMRCGEILGLTWGHVNLAERYCVLPRTKNGDSRQVPLSSQATWLLWSMIPIPDGFCGPLISGLIHGGKGGDGDAVKVFSVSSPTLDVLFRRARDRAAVECPSCATVRFHDARSEAITRLSRKLDVLELARVVGHRSLSSLMFYYAKSAAEIAKKLD